MEGANPHLEMRFLNLGPFQDTTTVHISVEDVDEPPVFDPGFYFVEVPEDVAIGTTIQIISAKDPDVTNNSIRFFHTFHLCLISENLPLYLIHFFFLLLPSLETLSLNALFFFSYYLEVKYHYDYNSLSIASATHTHTPLSAQSWPYWHLGVDNLLWGGAGIIYILQWLAASLASTC